MKKMTILFAATTLSCYAFAYEGTHPGLPPTGNSISAHTSPENSNPVAAPQGENEINSTSSYGDTGASSISADIHTRGNSVNTKYGTAMTPEQIKAAKDQRRAMRDKDSGGPDSVLPVR